MDELVTSTEISEDEFSFDGWEDEPADDETAEEAETDEEESETEENAEESEADQPSGEPAEENTEGDANAEEKAEEQKADQLFELKHLDETKSVGKDEVISLAQKGMDYDRVKEKYDALKAEKDKFSGFEEQRDFIKELADAAGQSVDQFIDSTRARMYKTAMSQQGKAVDDLAALLKVQGDKAERAKQREAEAAEAKAKEKTKAAEEDKAARAKSFKRFADEHKDVKAEDIPRSVWDDYAAGKGDLSDIYTRHENKQLKDEIARLRQELKNKGRSTGSRHSAGAKPDPDPDFAGWDD